MTDKVLKKTMRPRNSTSGYISFSVKRAATLKPGLVVEVYEPNKPKVEKYCRGQMTLTQDDINSMEMRTEKTSGEMFYLMAYNLEK